MRALVYGQFGPSSVLEVREIGGPHPGVGQVRIRVGASSVNPIDGKSAPGSWRKQFRSTFPLRPGLTRPAMSN